MLRGLLDMSSDVGFARLQRYCYDAWKQNISKNMKTVMIHIHALDRGNKRFKSPADDL
jgi:hypothetical protein